MARTIARGEQGFEDLRKEGSFYVDKTGFIRDWWLSRDKVTLICRPRRFGKTLNLDTVRCFLSTEFAGRGEELFGGLDVFDGGTEEGRREMRALQGTVPVLSLSFARVRVNDFPSMLGRVSEIMVRAKRAHSYLLGWEELDEDDRDALARIRRGMDPVDCASAPNTLCDILFRYWGTRPVVLLDEYDTPMELAWTNKFWDEAASFMGDLMVNTFKDNTALARGLMTGITRVSRESIFSELNNPAVETVLTEGYTTAFGFTQAEVDDALAEYGLSDRRERVREWYDGYAFGGVGGMYNPWSIAEYLASGGTLRRYWANTSGNGLISRTLRECGADAKCDLEALMRGEEISKVVDEQVAFSELEGDGDAVWGLLLAAGYLTAPGPVPEEPEGEPRPLRICNHEVELTFDRMVARWFDAAGRSWGGLAAALLTGDREGATECLSDIALHCMSSFDGGTHPSRERRPESFYHGLVLGLLVSLRATHVVRSNAESGLGRCDVVLEPKVPGQAAAVLELKVQDPAKEKTLKATVRRAKRQVEKMRYVEGLVERGIAPERICTYGIAFCGKEVLVG